VDAAIAATGAGTLTAVGRSGDRVTSPCLLTIPAMLTGVIL
jgi:hypothetical protein